MTYFLVYALGLMICIFSIDRASSSFWESFLAPAGAWIFGILLVLWLIKRLTKDDHSSGGGYGGGSNGGFWGGDGSSGGDGGGCGGGGE
jgi:uncharacterized membrane protein YgcG